MKRFSPFQKVTIITFFLFFISSSFLFANSETATIISQETVAAEHYNIGEHLPIWSVIPFIGILLSIAVFPLVAPHFWHKNFLFLIIYPL